MKGADGKAAATTTGAHRRRREGQPQKGSGRAATAAASGAPVYVHVVPPPPNPRLPSSTTGRSARVPAAATATTAAAARLHRNGWRQGGGKAGEAPANPHAPPRSRRRAGVTTARLGRAPYSRGGSAQWWAGTGVGGGAEAAGAPWPPAAPPRRAAAWREGKRKTDGGSVALRVRREARRQRPTGSAGGQGAWEAVARECGCTRWGGARQTCAPPRVARRHAMATGASDPPRHGVAAGGDCRRGRGGGAW